MLVVVAVVDCVVDVDGVGWSQCVWISDRDQSDKMEERVIINVNNRCAFA